MKVPGLRAIFEKLSLHSATSITALALTLSGCGFFGRGPDTIDSIPGIQPLAGTDLLVGPVTGAGQAWVTAQRSLNLRFQAADSTLPPQVVFMYRQAHKDEWIPGPSWTPGDEAPRWSPPWEGRWELCALPFSTRERLPARIWQRPHVVVDFDWTAPRVEIDRTLPENTVAGGTQVGIEWRLGPGSGGADRVALEISEGMGRPWVKELELPNTGHFLWHLPNRPLAGARVRLHVVDAAGNTTNAEVPGRLTVQNAVPELALKPQIFCTTHTAEVPYAIELPGGGIPRLVELWITEDGGANWSLNGYDTDCTSPFATKLAEGRYGYAVVVEDTAGNRSSYPRPGDPPFGQITVDWRAPTVEWEPPEVTHSKELTFDGDALIDVAVPYHVRDLDVDEASLAFEYRAGQSHWTPLPEARGASGIATFHIAEHTSEPITLRVTGQDRAGNGFSVENPFFPSEILNPSTLEFTELPEGWHAAGEEVLIGYRSSSHSANAAPIDLFYRVDQGRWIEIASGLSHNDGYAWRLPTLGENASVELKLAINAANGRSLEVVSAEPFQVDSTVPQAAIIGPKFGHGEENNLFYKASDRGGSGLARVEVFARRAGSKRWEQAGAAAAAGGESDSVKVRLPGPGAYDLWLVACDEAGNRSAGPEGAAASELFAFTVEEGPSSIELSSFQKGGVFAGGGKQFVFFAWRGGPTTGGTVDIEFSRDDGFTWERVGTVPTRQDRFLWNLPDEDVGPCRLRLLAQEVDGRESSDQSREPFFIDVTPPEAEIVEVAATAQGGTRVTCQIAPASGAAAKRVWLDYTADEGLTWQNWAEPFAADAPLVVNLPSGHYGFRVRVEDEVGNVNGAPRPGTRAQTTVRVGAAKSAGIAIVHPNGNILPGGTRHYVFWELEPADSAFAERPVLIEYNIAGEEEWHVVEDHLPPSGKTAWFVPEREGAKVSLRAVAYDVAGRRLQGVTAEPVTVDSEVPFVILTGPISSNRRPTIFEYRQLDEDSLDQVELWIRAVSTPNWKLAASAPIGAALAADIPDGMYRVALVGVDRAGNRGKPPAEGELGQGDLLVDTVPPLLEVDGVGERKRMFHAGEWLVLRPRVQDRHLSAFPLSFRFSEDGGANHSLIKQYHSNGVDLPWRVPEKPGIYQLEVTAEDLGGNRGFQIIPVQVISAPPAVTVLTDPAGSVLSGGDELALEWECRGVEPLHLGMDIEFTADGEKWEPLFTKQSADGRCVWKLPAVDSNRCGLRFTVKCDDGMTATAQCGSFTISSTSPRVRVDAARPVPRE